MAGALEFLHLVRADEDLLLLQHALQVGPHVGPPSPVERLGHDFDDDELIVFDLACVRRPPSALCGSSGKSREAAELFGEDDAKLAELSVKGRTPGRQEDLDDMHEKTNAKRARAFTLR